MLVLTHVGTKMLWECLRNTRSGDEVFTSIRSWVEYTLKTYPEDHILRHCYAVGGAELIDQRIKKF